MRSFRHLLTVVVMLVPLSGFAAEKTPNIVAAVVEDTASAEVVRLVVSPATKAKTFKTVCGDGMIRVRLEGVGNRGRTLQTLSVPRNGPLRKVRIVEKNPKYSVIQLYPKRNPLGTCADTTVVPLGEEIVISTALTPEEIARRAVDEKHTEAAAVERPVESVRRTKALPPRILEPQPASAPRIQPEKSAEPRVDEKTPSPLFKSSSPADAAQGGPITPGGQEVMSAPKVALGFGFAAVMAGLALYFRKRKKLPIDEMENIEILSTKRLGIKHQLMLVSVQGVKFLLAVNDKSITSLGTVPTAGIGSREDEGFVDAPRDVQPSRAEPSKRENVAELLETLIGEASNRAARPLTEEAKPIRRPSGSAFDEELGRAMQSNLRDTGSREVGTPDSASNAAGLVAMARMRANLRKNTGRSNMFEA